LASAFFVARNAASRSSSGSDGSQEGRRTVTPEISIRNRRIDSTSTLDPPRSVRAELPLTDEHEHVVNHGRAAITSILDGSDDRLLVIVGPCSIHDPVAGLEYACRLVAMAGQLSEQLCLVMRAYVEKPRTTVGWKGLVNDPDLDGSFRINEGLLAARAFLLDVVSLGIPVGCEFLDPITAEYLADAVSWGAIGARTSQSQIHRQLASGLSMPIGFKNSTQGDVQVAVDAVAASAAAQVFPGIDEDGQASLLETRGNPDGHIVLRGSSAGPNYDPGSVDDALDRLERSDLPPRLVIDASHANSGKDHRAQTVVAADVAARLIAGEPGIVGLMLESFLVPGRQDHTAGNRAALAYGQSITDACIGWDATVAVLGRLAGAITGRRGRTGSLTKHGEPGCKEWISFI
jgi:3-deoxy-7-phosphoheptulonate synthase